MTYTEGGGKLTVSNVGVTEMNTLGTALFVEGAGSAMSVTTMDVNNIRLFEKYRAGTSRNFNVIIATGGATATASGITVTDCDGVDVSLFVDLKVNCVGESS